MPFIGTIFLKKYFSFVYDTIISHLQLEWLAEASLCKFSDGTQLHSVKDEISDSLVQVNDIFENVNALLIMRLRYAKAEY